MSHACLQLGRGARPAPGRPFARACDELRPYSEHTVQFHDTTVSTLVEAFFWWNKYFRIFNTQYKIIETVRERERKRETVL